MGAISRKTSDRQIAGSTLIVTGQQILTVKRFPNTFQYKYRPLPEDGPILPVTTTTTTQEITTCYILTQDYDNITTQDNYVLIWC
jgi:hypothetical protein